MLLARDVVCNCLGNRFPARRFTVIRHGEIDVERKRVRLAGQSFENRLGLVELVLRQPGDGGPDAGLALESLDFEGVGLDLRLGARGEILADALTVEPTANAKNDLPGGIREL